SCARPSGTFPDPRFFLRVLSRLPASTFPSEAAPPTPADLKGKRIGLPEYQITAVVWMRGMLQHEYGVLPKEIHWRSGGQEEPGRDERTPLKPIAGLDLKPIGKEQTPLSMLPAGDLDPPLTPRAPSS